MLRRQTRITHGHAQAGVTQDFLQGEDVAAVLYEVAGEGVSQGVGGLAFRQVDGRPGSAQVATTNQRILFINKLNKCQK